MDLALRVLRYSREHDQAFSVEPVQIGAALSQLVRRATNGPSPYALVVKGWETIPRYFPAEETDATSARRLPLSPRACPIAGERLPQAREAGVTLGPLSDDFLAISAHESAGDFLNTRGASEPLPRTAIITCISSISK